jgi:hypothetical protein
VTMMNASTELVLPTDWSCLKLQPPVAISALMGFANQCPFVLPSRHDAYYNYLLCRMPPDSLRGGLLSWGRGNKLLLINSVYARAISSVCVLEVIECAEGWLSVYERVIGDSRVY